MKVLDVELEMLWRVVILLGDHHSLCFGLIMSIIVACGAYVERWRGGGHMRRERAWYHQFRRAFGKGSAGNEGNAPLKRFS